LFAGITSVVRQGCSPEVSVSIVRSFEAVGSEDANVNSGKEIDPEGKLRAVGGRLLKDREGAWVKAFVEATDKVGLVDGVADEVAPEDRSCVKRVGQFPASVNKGVELLLERE
jgi:hypothetical protein